MRADLKSAVLVADPALQAGPVIEDRECLADDEHAFVVGKWVRIDVLEAARRLEVEVVTTASLFDGVLLLGFACETDVNAGLDNARLHR